MRARVPFACRIDETGRNRDPLDPGSPADGSRFTDAITNLDALAPYFHGFDVTRGVHAEVHETEEPAIELEDAGVHPAILGFSDGGGVVSP